MVGGKKFPYTEKGKAAAKKAAGVSKLPARKGDNPGITNLPARKGESVLNAGRQRRTGDMFVATNKSAADKMRASNKMGPQDYQGNDDPKKRMADLRKTMLKRRLKSKGMK
jgi:hypothetical protein